jgi:integrase/recombinase XerD
MKEQETTIKKKVTRKLPKCVRPEEFIELIKVIPKNKVITKIGFLLAYGAGLRLSEVLNLMPEYITNNIFIKESKYGVDRITPIPKGWKEEYKKYLPLNEHTSSRNLQRQFKTYARKAKLNDYYTFHSLRHGFATRLLEQGAPINQVSILLGHANISTTSIYLKANPTDALKSYEDLF